MINYSAIRIRLSGLLIGYTAFENSYWRLSSFVADAGPHTDAQVIAVLGESRTGKSRLLEAVESLHPPRETVEGKIVPVIRIRVARSPTIKGVVTQLLHRIGDPHALAKESETTKMLRLKVLLRVCETKVVMLDEFQHVLNNRGDINYEIADFVKALADESHVNVVLCGLPNGEKVIDSNEQLVGRTVRSIRMSRLTWPEHLQDVKAILLAYKNALSPLELPPLDNKEWALRFMCATGGLMGYFHKIFNNVLLISIKTGTTVVTLEDFNKAFQYANFKEQNYLKPFCPEFDHKVDAKMLTEISSIGAAMGEH